MKVIERRAITDEIEDMIRDLESEVHILNIENQMHKVKNVVRLKDTCASIAEEATKLSHLLDEISMEI
jgi:hypothetical protein